MVKRLTNKLRDLLMEEGIRAAFTIASATIAAVITHALFH